MWSHAKGIFRESHPDAQLIKLDEEYNELEEAIGDEDKMGVKDAIGDSMVVLNNIAKMHSLNLTECFEHAANEIKDRPGQMVEGVFVKDE
jgi:NTP pyrophosphatase (non-canonical NTP hydrolase)